MRCVLALVVLTLAAQPTLASKKPCRDGSGKIVDCPKPQLKLTRCKDANGKFVPCPAPETNPTSVR